MEPIEIVRQFINQKLIEIAHVMPDMVRDEPSSFGLGNIYGYKQALLDLDRLLEDY